MKKNGVKGFFTPFWFFYRGKIEKSEKKNEKGIDKSGEDVIIYRSCLREKDTGRKVLKKSVDKREAV